MDSSRVNLKYRKTMFKVNNLIFVSITLLFISMASVNALIIGNREDSNFKGIIDEIRIYNQALSEEEAIQHYYSYLNKYDIDKWSFYTNQSNLAEGTYSYYGCAKDEAGNNNCTETRVLTICADIDDDDICDKDEPEGCVGENALNVPDDTDCVDYNGFNYETGCWKKIFKQIGTACNLEQWYYNYSCSDDKANIIKRHYNWTCNGAGSCDVISIGNIETVIGCPATRNCSGPDYSFTQDYACVCKSDEDGDGLCDGDDLCPKENSTNFNELGHTNTECIEWIGFNPTIGCHVNITYAGMIIAELCDQRDCHFPFQVNWTCNDAGGLYIPNGKDCDQMYQECVGDPDFNLTTCANNFSKQESEIICQEHEEKCWSPHKPYYPSFTQAGCCGDDLDECWLDGKWNACCYYINLSKVVYLTDPDESLGYCLLLGENKTGNSAGSCDDGEAYCWDSNSKQCCGDDPDETWRYSTSYRIGDVLVNETCYKGKWTVIKKKETTYFDLMSKILEFFS